MRRIILIICLLLLVVGCTNDTEVIENDIPEKITLDLQYGKVFILKEGEVIDSENDLLDEEIALLEKRINVINFNFYHVVQKEVNVDSYEHIDLKTADTEEPVLIFLCEPYIKYGDRIYNLGYDHEIFGYTDVMIKERKN